MSRWRGAIKLGALYALPAAAWVVLARWVIRPLIRDAYQGHSFALLNRVFQGNRAHPVTHYLGLWRMFWEAVLLAWVFHLVVVLAVRATNGWIATGRSPEVERTARTIDRWLIGFALVFLMVTALSGRRHDYVAFLEIWDAVRAGRDPWWVHARWGYPLHAYGPLFNLFAVPAERNGLAPKLLFALAYCLFAVLFLKGGLACARGDFFARSLLAWLIAPFAWVEIAIFGHFDVLPAIACVAAVGLLCRGREVLSGVSLAVGFLLKLIPVVIVPLYAFDRGSHRAPVPLRVRFGLLAGAVVPIGLGYGLSACFWGLATFRPFGFAYTRGSTLMSIFRYLRGSASPLRWFIADPNLDAWSTPCMAAAGLLVFLVCLWRRAEAATSALLAVLATLLFYKVGFIQYQMILFLLMACWLGRYAAVLIRNRSLALAIGAYFGWLSLFDLVYCYAGGIMHEHGPWGPVADRVGLPTFLLGGFLLVNLLRVAGHLEDANDSNDDSEPHRP
jgi:hypothetical protein